MRIQTAMNSIGDTIAIIGVVTGGMSAAWMAIAKYGKIRELIYANKRDLAHANNNAAQANKAFIELDMKVDLLETELVQTQTIIQMLLAERGQTSSEILGYKRRVLK
jgi:hypothetical protein